MEEDSFNSAFDLGFLSPEEANEILGSNEPIDDNPKDTNPEDDEQDENITDEVKNESQESVGNDENKDNKKNTVPKSKGSPNNISSIARAFRDYGVLPSLTDEDVDSATDAESFAELMEKELNSRLDEETKFYKEAYNAGIAPNVVENYQKTMDILNNITDEAIADEVNGEELRKNLIVQNYINTGMTQEKALRWAEKSIANGDDIDDAKDALQSIKDYYTDLYNEELTKGRNAVKVAKEEQKKQADALKKSILEDEKVFGELDIDKKTRQKIYNSISVAKHKDGNMYYSDIQQYQKENPTDFLKYVGLFYTLTDGFTNLQPLIKGPVKRAAKKNTEELQRVLDNTSRSLGGNLSLATGINEDSDVFKLDNWTLDTES